MNERRSIVRQKSFMQGRVYLNHRRSSLDCIIRDFTDMGARLQFSDVTALPDTFEVYIPSKDDYFQARAVWHKSSDVGVVWSSEGTVTVPTGSHQWGDPMGDRIAKLEHQVAALRKRLNVMQD